MKADKSEEFPVVNSTDVESIKDCIHIVRGVQVILDFDLAALYGYSTKDFNRQVKNNIEKFDSDFMFLLTPEEVADLRCKNFTSRWGGTRYLPHAFTEQGVYMLMTVLRGELATRQSKAIVRTFKQMKDYIVQNRGLLGERELLQLSLQTSKNIAQISELKGSLAQVEDRVAGIVDRLGEVVTKSELADVMLDFGNPAVRRGWLILNGHPVESDMAYTQIYAEAQRTIFVVDNYIGLKTLILLKEAVSRCDVTVFSDNLGKGLSKAEFDDFCKEYGKVDLKTSGGIFHDRYIILDFASADEKIYHCGASSKDGGNRVMTIEQVSDKSIYRPLVERLLLQPTLTLK